jgi:hypothetical protein
MHRRLRIAVTVLGLTASMLFAALWVRSYWRSDVCAVAVSKSSFVGISSTHGTMTAYRADNGLGYFNSGVARDLQLAADQRAARTAPLILASGKEKRAQLSLRPQPPDNSSAGPERTRLTRSENKLRSWVISIASPLPNTNERRGFLPAAHFQVSCRSTCVTFCSGS